MHHWKINKNKIDIFTFNNGINVVGIMKDGILNPLTFNSEISAEKYSNRFFEMGIYTSVITLKIRPDNYFIQILNPDINKFKDEGEFLTISQLIKRGLVDLDTSRLNKLCKKLQIKHPEKIIGGGQGKSYRIHTSVMYLFERKRNYNKKNF